MKDTDVYKRQYVICPLVEESENMEAENVTDYAKRLREELPEDIVIGVLHGQMKAEQKNKIMDQFVKNEIQVLVSTTVVEVGVNVPNATVMMIDVYKRQMQNDAVLGTANVLETYIYYQTFNSGAIPNYGYTTAVGLFKSLVGCVLVLFCNHLSKKVRDGRGIV